MKYIEKVHRQRQNAEDKVKAEAEAKTQSQIENVVNMLKSKLEPKPEPQHEPEPKTEPVSTLTSEAEAELEEDKRSLKTVISYLLIGVTSSMCYAIGFEDKRPSFGTFLAFIYFILVCFLIEKHGGKK